MSESTLGDADLLAQHVAGDPNAFGELVTRHRDRLWAVALRTLGNREDAADAVQDALLSAYRGAAGFRGGSAVTTWLHRIVVNACLDLARRRAVRPTQPLLEEPATSAPDALGARDTALAVTAALRTLPIDQAAAVVLVDIEGYSVEEASRILGVPTGTVKSRCARARARLAEQLYELDPRRASSGNDDGAQRVEPVDPAIEEQP
ncbi:MAG TPA: RNA polymerase sigma factor SigM [Mycobacteriales bacterium]|jgi:RNA polymerase sigma-70 factor (ECF subfamily)|nr:RNA polymerase sigma factor SigM [Mycobacteriales bacterium]